MKKISKPNPDDLKETFGLFLKQSDVNYTFTNLVVTERQKAIDLAQYLSDQCDVTCVAVDESFSILRKE